MVNIGRNTCYGIIVMYPTHELVIRIGMCRCGELGFCSVGMCKNSFIENTASGIKTYSAGPSVPLSIKCGIAKSAVHVAYGKSLKFRIVVPTCKYNGCCIFYTYRTCKRCVSTISICGGVLGCVGRFNIVYISY